MPRNNHQNDCRDDISYKNATISTAAAKGGKEKLRQQKQHPSRSRARIFAHPFYSQALGMKLYGTSSQTPCWLPYGAKGHGDMGGTFLPQH